MATPDGCIYSSSLHDACVDHHDRALGEKYGASMTLPYPDRPIASLVSVGVLSVLRKTGG